MKDKVLVRICIPMADIANDFFIPRDICCGVAAKILSDMIKKNYQQDIPISDVPLLWYAKENTLLDEAKSFREIGITDSDMLLLI